MVKLRRTNVGEFFPNKAEYPILYKIKGLNPSDAGFLAMLAKKLGFSEEDGEVLSNLLYAFRQSLSIKYDADSPYKRLEEVEKYIEMMIRYYDDFYRGRGGSVHPVKKEEVPLGGLRHDLLVLPRRVFVERIREDYEIGRRESLDRRMESFFRMLARLEVSEKNRLFSIFGIAEEGGHYSLQGAGEDGEIFREKFNQLGDVALAVSPRMQEEILRNPQLYPREHALLQEQGNGDVSWEREVLACLEILLDERGLDEDRSDSAMYLLDLLERNELLNQDRMSYHQVQSLIERKRYSDVVSLIKQKMALYKERKG